MERGGALLLAVISPGLLGIFLNLRQYWKGIDLFLTSVKVSFVASLRTRIPEKRGGWEKFRRVLGKALFSNGHKAIHYRAMLIALFDYIINFSFPQKFYKTNFHKYCLNLGNIIKN